MDPFTMAAIGAGAGFLKGELIDRPKEQRDRRLAAETQRWSPWTGLQAGPVKSADPFGSALQGGMAGASMGQSMAANKAATAGAGAGMSFVPGQKEAMNLGLAQPQALGAQVSPALMPANPYQDLMGQYSSWYGLK